jgi:hypothetical protein
MGRNHLCEQAIPKDPAHLLPGTMRHPADHRVLASVSRGYPRLAGSLITCYSPVRHATHLAAFTFDLHASSTPPTFVLSQDQTLRSAAQIAYYSAKRRGGAAERAPDRSRDPARRRNRRRPATPEGRAARHGIARDRPDHGSPLRVARGIRVSGYGGAEVMPDRAGEGRRGAPRFERLIGLRTVDHVIRNAR